VRPAGKNQATRLGSARNDGPECSRSSFLWGRALLLAVLPGLAGLFLCVASGHTRRCRRQPTGEAPVRRGCRAVAAQQHPPETAGPATPTTAFRRPGWKAVAAVRVLAGRCLGWFSPGVSQTEVGRKRYPDNLRRLYFACWNGFRP
jgi:hypothetical protein